MRGIWLGLAALWMMSGTAAAQDAPMTERTEKLSLQPHRVKGLLLGYGYTVGEFTGEVRARASSTRAVVFSSGSAKTDFTFASPGRTPPVQVSCAGGESRLSFAWITFKRQDLTYVCNFTGGPADAAFALALSEGGGMMARLYQPQRAAELTWGGVTLRAETRKLPGAMPIGAGGTMSYVITRDGREIGGMIRGALKPTFHLPPAGDPDREPAALMALALYTFADPANQN